MQRIPAVFPASFLILALAAGPAASQETPGAGASFSIARALFTTAVEDREPADEVTVFPASAERAWCFLDAREITAETAITMVWHHGGEEVHRYTLKLGQGPRWRTGSYVSLRGRTGEWRVELVGAAGITLRTMTFEVR